MFESSKSLLLFPPSRKNIPPPRKICDCPPPLTTIWKTPIYKILLPLFVNGMHLPQGYTEPLWGDSLLFTRHSWYSLNLSRVDERLRRPWSHPVVLNLYIYLLVTKYKWVLKWVSHNTNSVLPKTKWVLSLIWQTHQKYVYIALHMCRSSDYAIDSVLLQIQFYNIFTNVPSIIFKSCQ